MFAFVSSNVEKISSTAIGVSFTQVMVTETVVADPAVAQRLSTGRYVNVIGVVLQ